MRTLTTQPPLGTPLNRSHSLSQGLIGCWLFNEGGGLKAVDSTRLNIIDAPLANGAVFKQSSRGNVGSLDGTNDTVIAATNFSPEVPVTLAAWVKPSGVGLSCIVSFGFASNEQLIAIQGSSKFGAITQTGVNNNAASLTTAAIDTWYFVVGVFASIVLRKIYVNGNFEAQNTVSNTIVAGTSTIRVGVRASGVQFFNGIVQNAMVWKRALSDSEIRQLYINTYCMFQSKKKL